MSDQRPQFSPSTLKLSERYGIDPARLDAILGAPKEAGAPAATVPPVVPQDPSKDWIEARRFEAEPVPPVVPPTPADAATPTVATPDAKPVVTAASKPSNVVIPKDVRSTGSTLSDHTQIRSERTVETKPTTSPLTWILGIALVGLLVLFLSMRGCDKSASLDSQSSSSPVTVDTVIVRDTALVQDTVKTPADSVVTPAVAPAKPKPRAPRRAPTAAANLALSTTSSFMAQEKLAELKADGNPKAYIKEVTRNGQTVYQVRTKK